MLFICEIHGEINQIEPCCLKAFPQHKCTNMKYGFNCSCDWEKIHPGTNEYSCEWCGLYTASKPRCNKCELN
jgi:hypothetical protein